MSKYSTVFVAAAAAFGFFCVQDSEPIHPIPLGTRTPASSHNVWRLALKEGDSGSAFPVAMKDDKHVLFLTAKHMLDGFTSGIVEDRTKQRKLKIVSHIKHEKEDIALLIVLIDKKVDLVPLGLELKRAPGMCVFNVGFTSPHNHWIAHRGWLMLDAFGGGMSSAFVKRGMSGGAVLTPNDGKAIGVLAGFAYQRLDRWEHVYKNQKQIGSFRPMEHCYEQSFYVPLAPHKKWLKRHGVE